MFCSLAKGQLLPTVYCLKGNQIYLFILISKQMEGFCVCMAVAQGAHWLSRRPRRNINIYLVTEKAIEP